MSAWADGYVSDIQYTSGFYRELAPGYLSTLLNIQGYRGPDPTRPFTYCELGCGQGFGTNVIAASYPHGQFWGFDFNPAQVVNANGLASAAGLTNIEFGEESFESLAKGGRPDLPKFDYITLHGIYSWISAENRAYIVDFISRQLKPGGVVYISYNCLPGWASVAPFQRLLREHAALNPGRSDRQVDGALAFAEKLKEAGAFYFANNPSLGVRMDSMKTANRNYLAHEYLNGSWHLSYHADVVRDFDRAKLTFAASASILDNLDIFAVQEPVRKILDGVTDPVLYQTVKDYASNQAFRKDIFVRGLSPLSRSEHDAISQATIFTSTQRRSDFTLDFKTPLGKATGSPPIYEPIMDALAEGGRTSIAELLRVPALIGQSPATLVQAFQLLWASAQAQPVYNTADTGPAIRLNRAVAEAVITGTEYAVLASPAVGNGLSIPYVDACGYTGLADGCEASINALRAVIWRNMQRTGRRLVEDGKPVESEEGNLTGLTPIAKQVLEVRLPLWRKLGMI